MAAFVQKEMSGAIFPEEAKSKDTSPDYCGTCLIGGVTHKISGWCKDGKKGMYLSLTFKPTATIPTATYPLPAVTGLSRAPMKEQSADFIPTDFVPTDSLTDEQLPF